jgi:hypothetical protein
MILVGVKSRLFAGKFLIALGIVLCILWVGYVVQLARPTDVWDLLPFVAALAVFLVGVVLAPFHVGVSYKRDMLLSLTTGALAMLSIWFFLFFMDMDDPTSAERYSGFARLQHPGVTVGMAVYRHSFRHLGASTSRYLALVSAFVVLILMWSLGTFVLLRILRVLGHRKSK